MPQRRLPGVFCLEGPWSNSLTDQSSVGPLLELLERRSIIRFAHRDAATIPEFETYLRQWSQKQYAAYGFGYLAFHGEPGALFVGRKRYYLEDLEALLRGRLAGRILYFGSCSTLEVDQADAERLRKVTKARAVCGYTVFVDWIEAAAFELNLLYAVSDYTRVDGGFRYLAKHHGGACERLGLRAVWNGGAIW